MYKKLNIGMMVKPKASKGKQWGCSMLDEMRDNTCINITPPIVIRYIIANMCA